MKSLLMDTNVFLKVLELICPTHGIGICLTSGEDLIISFCHCGGCYMEGKTQPAPFSLPLLMSLWGPHLCYLIWSWRNPKSASSLPINPRIFTLGCNIKMRGKIHQNHFSFLNMRRPFITIFFFVFVIFSAFMFSHHGIVFLKIKSTYTVPRLPCDLNCLILCTIYTGAGTALPSFLIHKTCLGHWIDIVLSSIFCSCLYFSLSWTHPIVEAHSVVFST